jgi:hypothetical protein
MCSNETTLMRSLGLQTPRGGGRLGRRDEWHLIGVSIGLALSTSDDTVDSLLGRADNARYHQARLQGATAAR